MFQSDKRKSRIVGKKGVNKYIERIFHEKMRKQPHEFVTLGRDAGKEIMKEIKNDVCDEICHIHKYRDDSSLEIKYCVAKFKLKSKTEILIEKEHEIDLQEIKILTHGKGNEGFFMTFLVLIM